MNEGILTTLAFVRKQSKGYTICKYVNWIGMHGKIGDKNNYRKHIHIYFE